MNHVYKLKKSKKLDVNIPVPEYAKSSSKGKATTISKVLLGMGLVLSALIADEVTALGTTKMGTSANGVTTVDIADPNSKGLSHNRYNDFNVNKKGLILNNSTKDTRTRLGGLVLKNTNLTNSATTILNQVLSTNKSDLLGFIEVAGRSANVIVANPNGIFAKDIGFINTNIATLTTGSPILSNEEIVGFDVSRGLIEISGKGVDATQTTYLNLLARQIKLDGQVNANKANLISGTYQYDMINNTHTPTTITGESILYSIDASALGSIYANRIKLVATESGVGVKMLGEAASSSDDFEIDANGELIITKASSQKDINIKAKSIKDSELLSKNDININSNIKVDTSKLIAQNDVSITNDSTSINNSQIQATNNININTKSVEISTDSFNENKADLSAKNTTITTQDVNFNNTNILATNIASITATNNFVSKKSQVIGEQSLEVNIPNTDNIDTLGLKLFASNDFGFATQNYSIKDGILTNLINDNISIDNISLKLANSLSINVGTNNITNNTLLDIAGLTLSSGNFINESLGNIISAGDFTISNDLSSFTNKGQFQADVFRLGNSGSKTLNFTNQKGATLLGNELYFDGNVFTNNGFIQILKNTGVNSQQFHVVGDAEQKSTFILSSQDSDTASFLNALASDSQTEDIDTIATSYSGQSTYSRIIDSLIESYNPLTINVNKFFEVSSISQDTVIQTVGDNSPNLTFDMPFVWNSSGSRVTNIISENDILLQASKTNSLSQSFGYNFFRANNTKFYAKRHIKDTILEDGKYYYIRKDPSSGGKGIDFVADNTISVYGNYDANAQAQNIFTNYKAFNGSNIVGFISDIYLKKGASYTNEAPFDTAQAMGKPSITIEDPTDFDMNFDSYTNSSSYDPNYMLAQLPTINVVDNGYNFVLDTIVEKMYGVPSLHGTGFEYWFLDGNLGDTNTVNALYLSQFKKGSVGTLNLYPKNATTVFQQNMNIKNLNIYFAGIDKNSNISIMNGVIGGLNVIGVSQNHDEQIEVVDAEVQRINTNDKFIKKFSTYSMNNSPSYIGIRSGGYINIKADDIIFNNVYTNSRLRLEAKNSININETYTTQRIDLTVKEGFIATGKHSSPETYDPNLVGIMGVGTNGELVMESQDIYIYNSFLPYNIWFTQASPGGKMVLNNAYSDTIINLGGFMTSSGSSVFNSGAPTFNIDLGADEALMPVGGLVASELNVVTGALNVIGSATSSTYNTPDSAISRVLTSTVTGTVYSDVSMLEPLNIVPGDKVDFGEGLSFVLPSSDKGIFVTSKNPNSEFVMETNPVFITGDNILGLDNLWDMLDEEEYNTDNTSDDNVQNDVSSDDTTDDTQNDIKNNDTINNVLDDKISNNTSNDSTDDTTNSNTNNNTDNDTNEDDNINTPVDVEPILPQPVVSPLPVAPVIVEKAKQINEKYKVKRLGDSNYEAHLIKQQLTEQIGRNLLSGFNSFSNQVKGMMQNAVKNKNNLGLTPGVALTPDQKANLTEDIVWPEIVVINGEEVLVPKVYLSQSTLSNKFGGGLMADSIEGSGSLDNSGDITGLGDDLDIKLDGDITNKGGTISAKNNLSIESTKGTITNTVRDKYDKKGGTIKSGGNLNLKAKKDIKNIGSTVNAGGDATLDADNITFDTYQQTKKGWNAGATTTTTNTKSNLGVGGNLNLKSKNDTTLAGTDTTVGGSLDVETGGNFEVVARQDTQNTTSSKGFLNRTTTSTTTSTSVGSTLTVGGNADIKSGGKMRLQGSDMTVSGNANIDASSGITVEEAINKTETTTTKTSMGFGSSSQNNGTTITDNADGSTTNKSSSKFSASASIKTTKTLETTEMSQGSNLNIGGNLNMKTKGDITVKGSNVQSGGNMDLDANNINVLDATNKYSKTSTEETIGMGVYNETDHTKRTYANAQSGTKHAKAEAKTSAEYSEDRNHNNTIGVRYQTVEHNEGYTKSQGSSLKSGGNMNLNAKEKLTVKGSNVDSSGNMNINANNVDILAGKEESWSSTYTETKDFGILNENNANIDTSASAGAKGQLGSSAKASAKAEGAVSSTNTVGVKFGFTNKTEGGTKSVGSSLNSGGNMNINANNKATFEGATVNSGGNMNIEATDIENKAAQDTTYKTSSSDTYGGGVLISGEAGAKAGAEQGANMRTLKDRTLKDQRTLEAEAGANGMLGARYYQENSNLEQGTTTNTGNTFTSGGNFNRTAKNSITDEATNVDAKGDLTQSAKTITDKEVHDTTYSNSGSVNMDARIGFYGEASAEIDEDKYTENKKPEVGTKIGVKATFGMGTSNSQTETKTAKTSSFKAAGNINSKSTEKTTLTGTSFEAGGNVDIEASELEYNAAKSTTTTKSNSLDVALEASVTQNPTDKDPKNSLDMKAEAGYTTSSKGSTTNTVGNIKGKNINITTTKGDMNLEGTKMSTKDKNGNAQGDITLDSKKDINYKSAKDTKNKMTIGGKAVLEKGDENSLEGSYETSNETKHQTGSMEGNNINIKSGGTVNLDGTDAQAQNNIDVDAKELNLNNVVDTKSDVSLSAKGTYKKGDGDKEDDKKESTSDASDEMRSSTDLDRDEKLNEEKEKGKTEKKDDSGGAEKDFGGTVSGNYERNVNRANLKGKNKNFNNTKKNDANMLDISFGVGSGADLD